MKVTLIVSSNKTLLAYRSKGGATEQAANTIADVLRIRFKLQVDLVNLGKEPSINIASYTNLIVGSGVRTGKIYKEALDFLQKNRQGKKLAFFIYFTYLSALKTNLPPQYKKLQNRNEIVEAYIKTALANYPNAQPVFVGATDGCFRVLGKVVAGKIDPEKTVSLAEQIGKKLCE